MTVRPLNGTAIEGDVREIDANQPETVGGSHFVRVQPSDPTAEQRMRLIELSGALGFWDDPREDIYTLEDGEPV